MNRLIQSLGELASTDENYEFYGDITFTYVTTEKRKTTYSFDIKSGFSTGKSFSEALILTPTNPQYDIRLFIESPVQYKIK